MSANHRLHRSSLLLSAALGLANVLLACGNDDTSHAEHAAASEHCSRGFEPDARDATMSGEPVRFALGADRADMLLPAEVIAWMQEQGWQQEHNDWHNTRRLDIACRRAGASDDECDFAQKLRARGLARAPVQEGQAGDGFAFVVMHRHMLRALREVFPKHRALFAGFQHVPLDQADDALHGQWSIMGSPALLGTNERNVDNLVFWRLHGWIDDSWERYRKATKLVKFEHFRQCYPRWVTQGQAHPCCAGSSLAAVP